MKLLSNGDFLWESSSKKFCSKKICRARFTRENVGCSLFDDELLHPLSKTEFEEQFLKFDRSIRFEKSRSVVFIGSSSIVRWKSLNDDFSHLPIDVLNRGFGGASLKQIFEQLKRIAVPLEPKSLVFYGGETDLVSGSRSEDLLDLIERIISLVRRNLGPIPIGFISIKGKVESNGLFSVRKETNRKIEKFLSNFENVQFINVFDEMLTETKDETRVDLFVDDKIHLNEKGYTIWRRIVEKFLVENVVTERKTFSLLFALKIVFFLIGSCFIVKQLRAKYFRRRIFL